MSQSLLADGFIAGILLPAMNLLPLVVAMWNSTC